jgi:hypothetical protein
MNQQNIGKKNPLRAVYVSKRASIRLMMFKAELSSALDRSLSFGEAFDMLLDFAADKMIAEKEAERLAERAKSTSEDAERAKKQSAVFGAAMSLRER